MCVIRLPVVAVSCSPPVASDKLTILFMPTLPFTLITVQIFFWDLHLQDVMDQKQFILHSSHLVENVKSFSVTLPAALCSVHSPAVCGSRVCHGGAAISLFE